MTLRERADMAIPILIAPYILLPNQILIKFGKGLIHILLISLTGLL